jgi:hypothetical protein
LDHQAFQVKKRTSDVNSERGTNIRWHCYQKKHKRRSIISLKD